MRSRHVRYKHYLVHTSEYCITPPRYILFRCTHSHLDDLVMLTRFGSTLDQWKEKHHWDKIVILVLALINLRSIWFIQKKSLIVM